MTDQEKSLTSCLCDALSGVDGWRERAKQLLSHNGEWACFVEVGVGEQPDHDCVLDYGDGDDCIYASRCNGDKHKCKYWAPKTDENLARATSGKDPIK